jgi:hypothetical protein
MLHSTIALLSAGSIALAGFAPGVQGQIASKFKARAAERPAISAEQKTVIEKQQAEHMAQVAGVLGISADDLKARIASGKSLGTIIADLKLNATDIQKKLGEQKLTLMKSHMADRVTSGAITQAQADAQIAAAQKAFAEGKLQMMGQGGMKGHGNGLHKGEGKSRGTGVHRMQGTSPVVAK